MISDDGSVMYSNKSRPKLLESENARASDPQDNNRQDQSRGKDYIKNLLENTQIKNVSPNSEAFYAQAYNLNKKSKSGLSSVWNFV